LFDITVVTAVAANGAITYVFKGYFTCHFNNGILHQAAILTGWHSSPASADCRVTVW
jgi:hypothetical protein